MGYGDGDTVHAAGQSSVQTLYKSNNASHAVPLCSVKTMYKWEYQCVFWRACACCTLKFNCLYRPSIISDVMWKWFLPTRITMKRYCCCCKVLWLVVYDNTFVASVSIISCQRLCTTKSEKSLIKFAGLAIILCTAGALEQRQVKESGRWFLVSFQRLKITSWWNRVSPTNVACSLAN